MTKCTKCGREHERSYCPFCKREEAWEAYGKDLFTNAPTIFSKRIRDNLAKRLCPTDKKVASVAKKLTNEKGLYLFGKVGCGKTMLAAKVVVEYARRLFVLNDFVEESVCFVTAPGLLQEIRASFQKDSPNQEEKIVGDLSSVRLLVIDDLGAEKTSEWALQTLYVIINNRYESMLPTIFTSNLSLDELAEKLGSDRIPSRIAGMCEIIELDGDDRRIERGVEE